MNDIEPLPAGNYCILELFGHSTLVGRYEEIEKFGTKMLALEPLFKDVLLPVVFHGGAAIYRLTPCEVEVARRHQPTQGYQLPPAILANVPDVMLPGGPYRVEPEIEDDDDDRPF